MVVDSSLVLSIYFNEKHQAWAVEQLESNRSDLQMSTINLAEVLILIQQRRPLLFQKVYSDLMGSPIEFQAPTVLHAEIAARARDKFPLNLGDCFAYALAYERKTPILTLDSDFKKCDLKIIMPSR